MVLVEKDTLGRKRIIQSVKLNGERTSVKTIYLLPRFYESNDFIIIDISPNVPFSLIFLSLVYNPAFSPHHLVTFVASLARLAGLRSH